MWRSDVALPGFQLPPFDWLGRTWKDGWGACGLTGVRLIDLTPLGPIKKADRNDPLFPYDLSPYFWGTAPIMYSFSESSRRVRRSSERSFM